MSSNAWRPMNTPAKVSQISLDKFEEWKREQDAAIAAQGSSSDPAAEEAHNSFMLRQNMNGYVCHKELDEFTECLRKKNLIQRQPGQDQFELNVNSAVIQKACRSSHRAYVGCMSAEPRQAAVLECAALEPHCAEQRSDVFRCMEANREEEARTGQPQCAAAFRSLLRCGLNHMWGQYWRAVAKFGDAEEFHLYELSRDDNKQEDYLRVVTTTEEQQRQYLRDRAEAKHGYYAQGRPSDKL